MKNPFLSFAIKAFAVLIIAFCIHLAVLSILNYPLYSDRIVGAYVANLILVIVVFGVLYLLRNKFKGQLGFLFLAGSVLKFAIFFMFFYPFYKADDVISRTEFAAFFIPYALGLILETVSLSKWLNNME